MRKQVTHSNVDQTQQLKTNEKQRDGCLLPGIEAGQPSLCVLLYLGCTCYYCSFRTFKTIFRTDSFSLPWIPVIWESSG